MPSPLRNALPSIQTMPMSHNPYAVIHKVIRLRLGDLLNLSARTDYTDPEAVADVWNDWQRLTGLLSHHAEVEEATLHPLLAGTEALFQLEAEHHAVEATITSVSKQLEALSGSVEDGHALDMALVALSGRYLLHMHTEETVALRALNAALTDAEWDKLTAADYEGTTEAALQGMYRAYLPIFNRQDRAQLVRDIINASGPSLLKPALQIADEVLTEEDATALRTDVGS